MKRKLLRQIATEWRTNIWLAIELILVSGVLWWIADSLWTKYAIYHEPLGFDISHCYLLNVKSLNENSPEYKAYPDNDAAIADYQTLVRRLESRPEIEAISTSRNAYFYNPNSNYRSITLDSVYGRYLTRWVTPGFFKVFRIHGINGETPEELTEALEKSPHNSLMVSDDLFRNLPDNASQSMKDFIGREFMDADSTILKLIKVFTPLRYGDYISGYKFPSIIEPMANNQLQFFNETAVRVKENMDSDFAESIMNDALDELKVGNWYIGAVQSFDDIRQKFNQSNTQGTRNAVVWSIFLLLNIFLGVLGTFWFRTTQRTPEIALRMSVGASRMDIFRRVVAEGVVILLAVTPFSMAICYMLTRYELNSWYWGSFFDPVRFFGCSLITFFLILLMIVIGSWIPARKAMAISPATALKTE